MGIGFLFGVMQLFGNKVMVMVIPHCEYDNATELYVYLKMVAMVNSMVCVFTTLFLKGYDEG